MQCIMSTKIKNLTDGQRSYSVFVQQALPHNVTPSAQNLSEPAHQMYQVKFREYLIKNKESACRAAYLVSLNFLYCVECK